MRVTFVSGPLGNLVDVVVRGDIHNTADAVHARDWLRARLGVESGVGAVMYFAPNRAVLSVPVALANRVRGMVFTGE